MREPFLLFAEDDNEDWILMEDTLEKCNNCKYVRVQDGVKLLEYLQDTNNDLPDILILDVKMPKMDGLEALELIRKDMRLKHIPTIMLTTSKLETDILKSFQNGCNSYIVKPMSFEDMQTIWEHVHEYWFKVSHIPTTANIGTI
jgi:two-component system response regulator